MVSKKTSYIYSNGIKETLLSYSLIPLKYTYISMVSRRNLLRLKLLNYCSVLSLDTSMISRIQKQRFSEQNKGQSSK